MIKMLSLLLEVSVEDLKRQFVDTNRINPTIFDNICRACNNKSAYITWACKRYTEGVIPQTTFTGDNINAWSDAFKTFERYKQAFEKKDINQYKTVEDITGFFHKVEEAKQKAEEKSKGNRVDQFKIGSVVCNGGKGYLIYKLPRGHEENRDVSIALGQTEHESLGTRGWCTACSDPTRDSYWKSHINQEDLYIIINPATAETRKFDKYQIQFGYSDARPYWVGNDRPLGDDQVAQFAPVYQWLHEHEGRPIPSYIFSALEFQRNLENSNATLEGIQVAEGIYKVDSTVDTNDWIRPVCVDIFGGGSRTLVNKILDTISRSDNAIYFTKGNGTWMITKFFRGEVSIPYSNPNSTEDRDFGITSLPITLLQVINEYGSTAASNRSAKNLYQKFKQICELENDIVPDCFKSVWEPDSFLSAEQCKKGTEGKNTYYIVPANQSLLQVYRDLGLREDYSSRNYNKGCVGIVQDGKYTFVFSKIKEDIGVPQYFAFKGGDYFTNNQANTVPNPDVIFKMYKALKNYDNAVVFPASIQKIADIKEGNSLADYEIPTTNTQASKLYKIPGDVFSSLVPENYTSGYYRHEGYVILGFISKWQFTLTSSGEFYLTGRWGSGGSVSWVESVSGLGETVYRLCLDNHITLPDGLRGYILKYPDVRQAVENAVNQANAQEQPAAQQNDDEAPAAQQAQPAAPAQANNDNSEEDIQTGEDQRAETMTIQRRVANAEQNNLLTRTTMHVADYIDSRGNHRQLTITENALHGRWSQFEYSLLRSRTSLVSMAIEWCQENDAHISDVYVWPNTGTWNGLLVCKDQTGQTVRIYRRLGYGMGASYRIYRNSNEWTLTL